MRVERAKRLLNRTKSSGGRGGMREVLELFLITNFQEFFPRDKGRRWQLQRDDTITLKMINQWRRPARGAVLVKI